MFASVDARRYVVGLLPVFIEVTLVALKLVRFPGDFATGVGVNVEAVRFCDDFVLFRFVLVFSWFAFFVFLDIFLDFPLRHPCAFPALSLRFPCGVGIGVGFVLFWRRFVLIWNVFVFCSGIFPVFGYFFGRFPCGFPCATPALALRSPAAPIFSQIFGSNLCPGKTGKRGKKEHDLGKKEQGCLVLALRRRVRAFGSRFPV